MAPSLTTHYYRTPFQSWLTRKLFMYSFPTCFRDRGCRKIALLAVDVTQFSVALDLKVAQETVATSQLHSDTSRKTCPEFVRVWPRKTNADLRILIWGRPVHFVTLDGEPFPLLLKSKAIMPSFQVPHECLHLLKRSEP